MMSSIATVVVVVVVVVVRGGGGSRERGRCEGIQCILLSVHLFILLSRLSTHVYPLYLVWFQTLPSGQGGKGKRKEGSDESTQRPWEPNYIVPRLHVWANR